MRAPFLFCCYALPGLLAESFIKGADCSCIKVEEPLGAKLANVISDSIIELRSQTKFGLLANHFFATGTQKTPERAQAMVSEVFSGKCSRVNMVAIAAVCMLFRLLGEHDFRSINDI